MSSSKRTSQAVTPIGEITTEKLLDPLARASLSIVTTLTLRKVGIDDDRRETALRRGVLVPIRRGVYRPAGSLPNREGVLRAACMACGSHAVASHRSALWLWGLADEPQCPEVTVPLRHR